MWEIIIGALTAMARLLNLSREAFATEVEKMGAKIREGALIPDDAFTQAQDDVARFDEFTKAGD